jgi:hypothetical protein
LSSVAASIAARLLFLIAKAIKIVGFFLALKRFWFLNLKKTKVFYNRKKLK